MNNTRLTVGDCQHSVLRVAHRTIAYTPYGHCRAAFRDGRPGFAGELREALTGHYLLGNGYRAYNPALMRFHSPDSLSPFGRGGLNAYAYCLGDPLNWRDPSGHFPLQTLIGVVGLGLNALTLGALTPLAISGMALGAASVAVDVARHVGGRRDDPLLGSMGLVLGALSVGVGILGLARAGLHTRIVRRFRSRVSKPSRVDTLEVEGFIFKTRGKHLEQMAKANPAVKRNLTQRIRPVPGLREEQTLDDYRAFLRRIGDGKEAGYLPRQVLGDEWLKALAYQPIDNSWANFIQTYQRVRYGNVLHSVQP